MTYYLTMVDEKTKRQIELALTKGGYELELDSSVILNKRGWIVRNKTFYADNIRLNSPKYKKEEDEDYGRLAEVDIVADKMFLSPDCCSRLIIECKKHENNPWVFIKEGVRLNRDVFSLNIVGRDDLYGWFEKNYFERHYYYEKELYTYYINHLKDFESKEKKKTGSSIYHAITQVLSALFFYWDQMENLAKLNKGGVCFMYPAVVSKGELLTVEFKEDKPEIKPANHVQLLVELEAPEPQAFLWEHDKRTQVIRSSKPVVIDIVSIDHLDKFLDNFQQIPTK